MQSLCGQSFAGKFSVTALQNRADVVGSEFSYADVQQRARDYAHHVVKKTVAGDIYVHYGIRQQSVFFR